MSEALASTIIGALSATIVALITIGLPLLASARKHARTAAAEMKNDHEKNVRTDLDDKHDELMRTLRAHGRRFGRIDRRIAGVERRLGVIEDTQPHPRRNR
jgi:predicted nucleic acid-binding protein